MTTTVMGQEEAGANRVRRPIVLTLDCPDNQRYLVGDNEVLQATYGVELTRIDVSTDSIGMCYIFPTAEGSEYEILKDRPDMSVNELRSKIKTAWIHGIVRDRFDRAVDTNKLANRRNWILDVTAIIIDENLTDGRTSTIKEALLYSFPRVPFFSVDPSSLVAKPNRIWNKSSSSDATDAPLCNSCGAKMRPAGVAYVCENCGSTQGTDDMSQGDTTRCKKCGGPTEVKMYGAFGAKHQVCESCGHAEPIRTI